MTPGARIAVLALLLLALPAAAAASGGHPEHELAEVIAAIRDHRNDLALRRVEALLAAYPNFRLAHLIRGDLLLARTRRIEALGNGGAARNERLGELRAEALARLRAWRERPDPRLVPRYLLRFEPEQRYAIVVDSKLSRLYVYENTGHGVRFVADYYTTLGKRGIDKRREGDQKTPIGVYYVTSSIPGSKLPDLYGVGAFPINYPNEWDRMAGRNGYGIWLHGVPKDTYSRAPWASDGCIVVSNQDLLEVGKTVQVGRTPVIIADEVQWVTSEALASDAAEFDRRLEAWRGAWESLDTERYLAYYAASFRSGSMDAEAWTAHKRRVNAAKRWIKVGLSNVSIFRSPGQEELVVVSFNQDYRSDNLAQLSRKRQFWKREGGEWRIVFEAATSESRVRLPESYPENPS